MFPIHPSSLDILPLVPKHILEQHHVSEGYDTRFAACARLLQSIWRTKRGFTIGQHKSENGEFRPMGSRLTFDIAQQGYNLVSPDIAKLVRREAAYREIGAVVDEERLWGNLLSSQPMTFNLFGKAKLDPKFGKRLLDLLFPQFKGELSTVYFEHSPGRGDVRFTGDSTAFDCAFVIKKADGRTVFIGVEVKYSETMRTPSRPFNPRIEEVAKLASLHIDPLSPALRAEPLSQLFAEHLLAYAAVHEAKIYDEGLFVLITPKRNREAMKAAQLYKSHLGKRADSLPFMALTLEEVIAAIEKCGEPVIASRLVERYTDFAPVHNLIDDWEPYRE